LKDEEQEEGWASAAEEAVAEEAEEVKVRGQGRRLFLITRSQSRALVGLLEELHFASAAIAGASAASHCPRNTAKSTAPMQPRVAAENDVAAITTSANSSKPGELQ